MVAVEVVHGAEREVYYGWSGNTDAQTAARIMRDRGIGSLFVTNGKEIVGILTDTDYGFGGWWRRERIPTRRRSSRSCRLRF